DPALDEVFLTGYLVWRGTQTPTAAELRAFLGERLPDAMIPGAYVTIPALPLTPSGKVDRDRLPAAAGSRMRALPRGVAPRTPMERSLAAIWSEVLGTTDAVGVHDNFFELGGSSLSTIQIVLRIRETFRVELPLRAIFTMPTVAMLAAAVEQG